MIRLNIVPLLTDHAEEISKDLIRLCRGRVIDSAAFEFTLVPEGVPAFDKAGECVRRFRIFQNLLKGSGLPVGILFQATMGHGWVPDSPADFQRIRRIDGEFQYTFCPEDPRFRSYLYDSVVKSAQAGPDFLMLDDDTRMITGRNACFCPLHTAMFNREYGTDFTSDSLIEAVKTSRDTAVKFDSLMKKSMENFARLIRSALDSVNPDLFCSFCVCAEDLRHAPEIARILAGKDRTPVVRINNGFYLKDSPRNFSSWVFRTAAQTAAFPENFTLLAEPDTCPQNRYSTSASFMRSHLILSLLEGCRGGKLWITRTGGYEPESGLEYRRVLKEDSGLLEAVSDMRFNWTAPAIPLPAEPPFNFPCMTGTLRSGWNETFGRMGIPFCFRRGPGKITLLTACQADSLSDSELREVFRNHVLLDGSAAIALSKRGLDSLTGVRAKPWSGSHVSVERWNGETIVIPGDSEFAELLPGKSAAVRSELFHRGYVFDSAEEKLSPGAVLFAGPSGGKVLTLACFYGKNDGFRSFSIFNEVRKRQILSFLNELAPLDAYCPGDAELMVKCGVLPDGSRIVTVFNCGLDPLKSIPLRGTWADSCTEPMVLSGKGVWKPLKFERENGVLNLRTALLPVRVSILKI